MRFLFPTVAFILLCNTLYPQTFDAELIERKTDIQVQDNKLVTTDFFKVRINKRAEEYRFTDIEITHQKNEKISSLEGWIEDSSGNIIRKLQKKEIVEGAAETGETFYDDYLTIRFTLRHNEYPYYICYSFTRSDPNYLVISNWSPVLEYDIPTHKATLSLTVPTGYEFLVDTTGVKLVQTLKLAYGTFYQWSSSYEKPLKPEVCAPPLSELYPRIKIAPKNFNYSIPGSFQSWSDYGKWFNDILSGLDKLPASEIIKANEMVKDVSCTRDKVRLLYHYLQDNTRYINVSTKFGGLVPMPAQYVVDNKYGDCKALTNYEKALLQSVGIKSYYTVVYAGNSVIESDKGIPFPNFNHIILLVPDGKDSIWLDCTGRTNPFNYLGSFSSGRKAFVINNDHSAFAWTQCPPVTESESVRNFRFKVDAFGRMTVDVSFLLKGDDFEGFLGVKTELDEKEQQKQLNRFLAYSNLEASTYTLEMLSRDSKEISFSTYGQASRFLKTVQNDFAVIPAPFRLPDFEAPAKRQLPVKLALPSACRDTIRVEVSKTLAVVSLPKDVNLENEFGFYRSTASVNGNMVTLVKEYCVLPGEYSKEKYPAFYAFISAVKKYEKSCGIILTNSSLMK
jgi:hypothetical protein